MIKEKIEATYPYQFEDELLNEIDELGSLVDFKANDVMIDLNQFIKGMPILLSGAIKIMREDFDEGELLLYFLEKMRDLKINIKKTQVLVNMYQSQIKKINKLVDKMHEDLQFDYRKQIKSLD